jgi:hypothetical protein
MGYANALGAGLLVFGGILWRPAVHGKGNGQATYGDAVDYLCRHVHALSERIDGVVWDAAIGTIANADPSGEEWRDAVRRLHDAAEAADVPGGIGLLELRGGFSRGGGFPDPPPPRTTGWVCPAGRCTRVELRADQVPTPVCDLTGKPMRLVL